MFLLKNVIFLLIFSIIEVINFTKSDCGCNKVNREENPLNDVKFNDIEENIQFEELNGKEIFLEIPEDEVADMVIIPGGQSQIGTNSPIFVADGESPEKEVELGDFQIDKYEVSNAKFKEFVEATNFKTEAEKFGDSFVFQEQIDDVLKTKYEDFRVASALWWYKVSGVNWKHPHGPESNIEEILDHPVVHVSWNDATAYCKWQNKRLPTESEWEVACRGGRKRKLYPWGDKLMPKNEHWLNIWQGDFPTGNTGEDGYVATCPVNKFEQNIYGLHNIVGNVWEWTADLWDPKSANTDNPNRVKKGGSFMCHETYCFRYRCAARSQNTEDSSASNLGFRCAKNIV